MEEARREVLHQTLVVLIGELICAAVMIAVFALLGRFSGRVLAGSLLGVALAVGNFFAMAVNASVAADRAVHQDVQGGQKLMRVSYLVRLAVIFGILVVCFKADLTDPIASAVPLLFPRWILTLAEFFKKSGPKTDGGIK